VRNFKRVNLKIILEKPKRALKCCHRAENEKVDN
jgi:hypothetical protein